MADATHKSSLDIKVPKRNRIRRFSIKGCNTNYYNVASLIVSYITFYNAVWYQWYLKQFMLDHLYFCGLKRLFGTTIGLFLIFV